MNKLRFGIIGCGGIMQGHVHRLIENPDSEVVALNDTSEASIEKMKTARDEGQGAIEYVGITILVVAIVVALLNTSMGQDIANAFTNKINEVLGGGGGGGAGSGAGAGGGG